jgi:hypothetical protein
VVIAWVKDQGRWWSGASSDASLWLGVPRASARLGDRLKGRLVPVTNLKQLCKLANMGVRKLHGYAVGEVSL